MPALQDMGGFIGLSLVVDRQSGECIATSAWESDEAQRASAEDIGPLRDRARRRIRRPRDGRSVGDRRSTSSAQLRHRRLHASHLARLPADQMDAGIEYFRSSVLPQVEHLDGFRSASLMVERGSGRAVSSVSFSSRAANGKQQGPGEGASRPSRSEQRAPPRLPTVNSSWCWPTCGCPSWPDSLPSLRSPQYRRRRH